MTAWLDAGAGASGPFVVTGSAGTGKSALIARFVALASAPPRIDAVLSLRHCLLADVIEQLARQLSIEAADTRALLRGIDRLGRPVAIVLDALEEADEREAILRLLGALVRLDNVRLIVGTRPTRPCRRGSAPSAARASRSTSTPRRIGTRRRSKPTCCAGSWPTRNPSGARPIASVRKRRRPSRAASPARWRPRSSSRSMPRTPSWPPPTRAPRTAGVPRSMPAWTAFSAVSSPASSARPTGSLRAIPPRPCCSRSRSRRARACRRPASSLRSRRRSASTRRALRRSRSSSSAAPRSSSNRARRSGPRTASTTRCSPSDCGRAWRTRRPRSAGSRTRRRNGAAAGRARRLERRAPLPAASPCDARAEGRCARGARLRRRLRRASAPVRLVAALRDAREPAAAPVLAAYETVWNGRTAPRRRCARPTCASRPSSTIFRRSPEPCSTPAPSRGRPTGCAGRPTPRTRSSRSGRR